MSEARPLDQDPVEALAAALLACIKAHYLRRPRSRNSALEVLNALAYATATVIAGAQSYEQVARNFFNEALEQNIVGIQQQFGDPE